MKSLKLIGVLLDYPADELWQHRDELRSAANDSSLSPARRLQLQGFVGDLTNQAVMDAQEAWLALFDRGRAMSLLLFEHIHGESRDRGQAMVDLMETYRKNGFEMATRELPDYLPLVLEYLSQRPMTEVVDWLKHTGPIIELLAARAGERQSPYALLFESLIEIGQGEFDLTLLRKKVASEARDDTPEVMDQVWEEEAVRFGNDAPSENCLPNQRLPTGTKRTDQATPAHPRTESGAGSAPAALIPPCTSQVSP